MLFQDQTTSVIIAAPAKLNLFLKVLGKRADGFHELETLMVSVGLYDTLRITDDPSGGLALSCHDAAPSSAGTSRRELPPADHENLVLRAAQLLRQTTGSKQGARLELFKRIPMAAGLAGGSSDAAAALVGLNHLWRLGLGTKELHELAARLGSDVCFFLCDSAAAICRGRGEIVEPRPMPLRLHFVIVRPQSGLSTAEVFRNCSRSPSDWSAERVVEAVARGRLDQAALCLNNGLQEPAERLNPEVTTLKNRFARQPFLGHMMTGSGSSYFGLCHTRSQALRLSARLKNTRVGDVYVAQSRP